MGSRLNTYLYFLGKDKTGAATKSAVGNLNKVKSVGSELTRALAPLGIAASATGFASLIKTQIDAADRIKKLSDRLGASTEALSEYQHVAESAGVTFETLVMGWQRMTRRVAEAASGMGEARGALRELNLDAQKLNTLAPERQFEILADALSGVGNDADRVRLAMKLFDSEGVSLLQTMVNGAAGIREWRESARAAGRTLTDDMASQAQEAAQSIAELNGAVAGLKTSLVNLVGDDVKNAISWINDRFVDMKDALTAREFNNEVTAVMKQLMELDDTAGAFKKGNFGAWDLGALREYAEMIVRARQRTKELKEETDTVNVALNEMAPPVTAAADAIKTLPTAYSYALGAIEDMGAFSPIEVEEILAAVDAMEVLGDTSSETMQILGDSAQIGAARMADAIERAVFESQSLLEGLGNVARSVFSSILSGFITMGVRSILPASWIGAGLGATGYAGDFIGPIKSTSAAVSGGKSSNINIGNLNVSASGTISNDPMSVRQLAVTVYDEIQKVAKTHG